MAVELHSRYVLGEFELDADKYLLTHHNANVHLPELPFQVLLYLVEHRQRYVSRQELLARFWQGGDAYEETLTKCISTIRTQLNDPPNSPRFIETRKKVGYRYIGPLQEMTVAPASATPEFEPTKGVGPSVDGDEIDDPRWHNRAVAGPERVTRVARGRNRNRWLMLGALLIVTVAGVAYLVYRKASRSSLPLKMSRLTSTGNVTSVAISPDGKYVAYAIEEAGQQSLWLRQVAVSGQKQIVAPDGVRYLGITFSRDGNSLYYVRHKSIEPGPGVVYGAGVLYKAPALGGVPEKQLTINVSSPVALSPDGKRLAFVRQYPQNADGDALIVVNEDGTNERKVFTRKQPNLLGRGSPSWSPDAEVIACGNQNYSTSYYSNVIGIRMSDGSDFPITSRQWRVGSIGQIQWLADGTELVLTAASQENGPSEIWRLSTVRDEASQVIDDLNGYSVISQSADSHTLAALRTDRLINIWVAPTDDPSRVKQITSGASREDGGFNGLDWTPDSRIVFHSNVNGSPNIWIMAADGAGKKQLSVDGQVSFPSVSPDGRYVFWRHRSETGVGQVWRQDLDGSNAIQLTNVGGAGVWFPRVTPDGKWVVYGTIRADVVHSIWKVSTEGGVPVQLTTKPSWVPVVSPDGKLLACNWLDQGSNQWKIAIMPFGGGEPTRIFDLPGVYNRRISWTPDGRALTFIRTTGSVSNIWSQPIDGGPPTQLTNYTEQRIVNFAWSRDGKQLALSRGIINADVVLMSNFK